ncbi:unnamed protein product [Schistosoma margrebowiei]|uniref:PH domain-containing protein n=1 Tax=Schistosoma margrebowiei TaxID=48269 RepID=A0AA85A868_9TREM|nr:unnamed protein product [Schistosoma margrebowiei]
MLYEKEITRDIRNFQKLCKERRKNILQDYKNEEKDLNEHFHRNYRELVKSHKKQLGDLQSKVEKNKRKFRRQLECELRSEKNKKKNLKKIYGRKSQSVNHLTNLDDLPASSISLNNLQTLQYNHNTNNNNDHHTTDNHSFIDHSNSSPQLPPITSSISPLSNDLNKYEIRSNNNNNRYIGGLNKHLSQSEHVLNSKRSFHGIEYNHELEERFDYYSMNHKSRIAEFEWKCLMERQELRRAYLLNLGELKQRRIMSLYNMTRLHIKTYYDIQKKWLCNIHSNELTQRNQTSHETLKKLTESQIIERQTACKLLKQSIKGQKQMIQLLEDNLKKDDSFTKSEQIYTTSATTNNTTNKTTYLTNINDYPKSRLFIEQLMESPYFIHEDYSSEDMIGIQKNRLIPLYSPSSITSVNGSSNSSNGGRGGGGGAGGGNSSGNSSCYKESQKSNDLNEQLKQSNSNSVKTRIVEIPTDLHQQNDIINRAKSTQSIHSTISAYESLSKTVLNIITNRQNDLWTSILEQEQLLTENLLKAQLEQLKLLVTSENAALKRCQMDYDNRIAYLSVTLEATQKFAELEFAEEQERLIQFYFPNSDTNNLRSTSGYPSETFHRDHFLHELNNDNTQLLKNNTDNNENSPENIRPVSSSIRKFEKYTNEHGQKIIPITFKTPSSSKFNSTNIQREMVLRQDTN